MTAGASAWLSSNPPTTHGLVLLDSFVSAWHELRFAVALQAFQVHLSVAFKFKSHSRLCEEFGKPAFEHMKDTI